MTFLLDLVVDVLARTVVWLAVETAIAVAIAGAVWWVADMRGVSVPPRRIGLAALVGVLAAASLAHRFDLADPGHLEVWRRPIYLLWSVVGALGGALASLLPVRIRVVR